MTRRPAITRAISRFRRDDSGATLVEMGLCIALTLLLFVVLLDFGRLAFNYVAAEKGVQVAARIAAVRPAACPGVPAENLRGTLPPDTEPPRYGTACRAAGHVCLNPGPVTCTASAADPTAQEIWTYLEPRLPNHATIANLRLRYDYDPNLGFLGGPYTPVVTVEVQNLEFEFLTPLGRLVSLAAGETYNPAEESFDRIPFPRFSASVPGEDLNQGDAG